MNEEINLSQKRSWIESENFKEWVYPEKDVKEFIKRQITKIEQRLHYLMDFEGLAEAELQMAELRKVREELIKDAGENLI